jgi:quercetin dioxygenase-like cupin family protein
MAESKIDDAVRALAADLRGLVAVQDGAIVSRTLLDAPAGTVTLFAFDAGQALSEHTTPFDAMVQVLEGRLAVTIAGTAMDVPSGSAVVMPANQPHALKAAQPTRMLLVMIRS